MICLSVLLKGSNCVYFKVPDQFKIELVRVLEVSGGDDVHPMLTTVFMDAAIEAIDKGSHVSMLVCYCLNHVQLKLHFTYSV